MCLRYEKYVAALEESSKDSLLVLKKKAVEVELRYGDSQSLYVCVSVFWMIMSSSITLSVCLKALFDLLKSKPEQERRLLAALVNKVCMSCFVPSVLLLYFSPFLWI